MKRIHASRPRDRSAAPPIVPPTIAPTLVDPSFVSFVCPEESSVDLVPETAFVNGDVTGEDVGD